VRALTKQKRSLKLHWYSRRGPLTKGFPRVENPAASAVFRDPIRVECRAGPACRIGGLGEADRCRKGRAVIEQRYTHRAREPSRTTGMSSTRSLVPRRISSIPSSGSAHGPDSLADAYLFAGSVEHRPDAVGNVDVGVTAAQEHGWVTARQPAKGVARGISPHIGFRLDNAADEFARAYLMDKRAADQNFAIDDQCRAQRAPLEAADSQRLGEVVILGSRCAIARMTALDGTLGRVSGTRPPLRGPSGAAAPPRHSLRLAGLEISSRIALVIATGVSASSI